jgi:hypothetical protein
MACCCSRRPARGCNWPFRCSTVLAPAVERQQEDWAIFTTRAPAPACGRPTSTSVPGRPPRRRRPPLARSPAPAPTAINHPHRRQRDAGYDPAGRLDAHLAGRLPGARRDRDVRGCQPLPARGRHRGLLEG